MFHCPRQFLNGSRWNTKGIAGFLKRLAEVMGGIEFRRQIKQDISVER